MTNEREENPISAEQERLTIATEAREDFERNLVNLWGHSATGLEAKRAAMTMLSTKTGMYAKIPITCKANACPYANNCRLLEYGLAPEGELCPIETAEIELRYQAYEKDFDLLYEDTSFTDRCIVSSIINDDIMLERCKALMANEGTLVSDVAVGVTDNGDTIYRPEVSKAWEAYERVSKRRDTNYQLMMATRKDKKDTGEKQVSLTEIIEEAMSQDDFLSIEQRPDKFKGE